LLGYNEDDFIDKFLSFVTEINDPDRDITNLSRVERDVVYSKDLTMHNVSRKWQHFMTLYLEKMTKLGKQTSPRSKI